MHLVRIHVNHNAEPVKHKVKYVTSAKHDTETMDLPSLLSITHWVRVTHLCIGNICHHWLNNGLSPVWPQAIVEIKYGILTGPLETNFKEIRIQIQRFSCRKVNMKMSANWWLIMIKAVWVISFLLFDALLFFIISQQCECRKLKYFLLEDRPI